MDLFEAIHSPKKFDKKTKKRLSLEQEYNSKGYKDFSTWDLEDDEVIERLKMCLKENMSYEEIYGEEIINDDIDY